jgi:hypothetical protein
MKKMSKCVDYEDVKMCVELAIKSGMPLEQFREHMDLWTDFVEGQRWIPCSERLPKDDDYKPFSYYEDGVVFFCTKDGKVGFGWYYESTREWANEDDNTVGDVIAWMPLPEPYREEKL